MSFKNKSWLTPPVCLRGVRNLPGWLQQFSQISPPERLCFLLCPQFRPWALCRDVPHYNSIQYLWMDGGVSTKKTRISNGIGKHIRRFIYRRVEERLAEVTVLQCIRLPLKRRWMTRFVNDHLPRWRSLMVPFPASQNRWDENIHMPTYKVKLSMFWKTHALSHWRVIPQKRSLCYKL